MNRVREFLGLYQTPNLETILAFIDKCSQPIVLTTYDYKNPTIIHANHAHSELTGYSTPDLIGKNPKIFQGKNTVASIIVDMHDGLLRFDCWDGVVLNYTTGGVEYQVYIVIIGLLTHSGDRYYIAAKSKL